MRLMLGFFISLLVLFLSYPITIYGNEPETNTIESLDPLPPSPNAASLGNFGEVNAGLHTGTVQYGIPIFTFKTRHLEVPISLNYSSNGLVVDQIASHVGLGWSFNAGGVITRNVRGWADEWSTNDIPDFNEYNQELVDYVHDYYNAAYHDRESDIYTFNFGPYSGKFVFDHNTEQFYTVKYSPLTISKIVLGDDYGFKINTPEGISYYFNRLEKSRYTSKNRSLVRVISGSELENITAWYLTKIVHFSGEEINFYYRSISYLYDLGPTQTITYKNYTTYNAVNGETCTDLTEFEDAYTNQLRTQSVVLDSIVCEGVGKVVVYSSSDSRRDIDDFRIDSLKIYNSRNPESIKKFKFGYENVKAYGFSNDLHTLQGLDSPLFYRLFLMSFEEYSDAKDPSRYEFGYYNKDELPPRFSFARDHWGYFNGKNNLSLLGEPPSHYAYSGFSYANKEPDSQYAIKGLLKTINYPTKGTTILTYEGHKYMKPVYPSPIGTMYVLSANSISSGGLVENTRTQNVSYGQEVTFNFSVTFCDLDNCSTLDPDFDYYGIVEIIDSTEDRIHKDSITILPRDFENGIERLEKNVSFDFYMHDERDYIINVKVSGHPMESYLSYHIHTESENPTYVESELGGVRIKKIEASDPSLTKYYYYNTFNNRYIHDPLYYSNPKYFTVFNAVKCVPYAMSSSNPELTGCIFMDCPHVSIHSSSIKNMFGSDGSNVYYDYVTESQGGENFENGGIEYHFENTLDVNAQIIYAFTDNAIVNSLSVPKTNASWNNGTLLKENYFRVESNQKVNVKTIDYQYAYQDLIPSVEGLQHRDLKNYAIRKDYDICCTEFEQYYNLDNFNIYAYELVCRWKPLISITTKEYDSSGNQTVESSKQYSYFNPNHAKRNKIVTTGSDGLQRVIFNKYAGDYLQTADNSISSLIYHGRIGELIEQQEWKVSDLIQSSIYQHINLDSINVFKLRTNQSVPLPVEYYPYGELFPDFTGLGTDAGYEITATIEFDNNYKPIQIAKEDDIITSYRYGYNNLYPVAVAENTEPDRFYYTSFEDDGTINSSAVSGEKIKILTGSYTVDETLLIAKDYILSYYWRPNDNNPWELQIEHYPYPTTTIQTNKSSGEIDELRFYPEDSHVSTYTYKPLVGMTSQTDPNGITTHYEYDSFGRLWRILNQNRNILKQYDYHYINE